MFANIISLSQAAAMCLVVNVEPDANPKLDGFRVVSHQIESMADLEAAMPGLAEQQCKPVKSGMFTAHIIVNLTLGRGQTDSQAAFTPVIVDMRFYQDEAPHMATIPQHYLMLDFSGDFPDC
jgi:hypothetical protein